MGTGIRAGAVLLFVFAAGALAGMVFERHHGFSTPATRSAVEEHEAAMAELTEALGLDHDQMEQIHAIMVEHQHVVQLKWEELRPEVQEAMRQVHSAIADILHADQIPRFHDWLRNRRAEHPADSMTDGER